MKPEIPDFGIEWPAGTPLIQRHQYCAYHNKGFGEFYHRKERIKALWPEYQWHRWNDRRLRGTCDYPWVTWLGPAASAKSTDASVFGLEYFLQAPDRTAVIVCSTTMKMLRLRIWNQLANFHQRLPKGLGPVGDLMDSVTRIRWQQGDDKHGIFGMAVEEGSVEEVVNNLIGIHTERVLLILDEMQGIREAIMRATNNMIANPKFSLIGMGNPDSLLNPLGRESEPIGGWDSVVRGETEQWETHGGPTKGNGLCQFFDGRKSPADDSLEERKRLPWLCNQEWFDGIVKAARGNKDDPQVWQMGIGWPPPTGLENTILDESMLTKFHCRKKAVWTHGFTRSAGFDPAFNGGDKAILQFAKRGEVDDSEGKRWVIELGESLEVPINVESSVPIPYQLVEYCKKKCTESNVRPSEFALDESGGGISLKGIFQKEWGDVCGVVSGGSPSAGVIDDTGKLAKDAYDNRSSELCFSLRNFALGNGIRGMNEDVAKQACARNTFYRNGKWAVEPKTGSKGRTDEKGRPVKGFKQRMGYSPDAFDAAALAVELCRQKGAVAGTGEVARSDEFDESVNEYRQQHDDYSQENYLVGYDYER